MTFKKISAFLLAFTFVFALPISTTNAGAGIWDYVGQRTLQWDSYHYTYSTRHSIVYSGGGNFKVCRSTGTGYVTYSLWEQDSSTSPREDDFVTSFRLGQNQCGTVNVANFVDGTNKKAEFYVVSTSNQSKVTFWD